MVPNLKNRSTSDFLTSSASVENEHLEVGSNIHAEKNKKYKFQIVWLNVFLLSYLHLGALYGGYLTFNFTPMLYTYLWAYLISVSGAIGITAGAHRLWSHRAYKAKWQLRVILAVFLTLAAQTPIYEWCRDHRVHHKFSETDADPHNATRGFFFSHIGWLMCRKHPDVIRKGAGVDMSDLEQDPIVMWQKKYYMFMLPIVLFVLPVFVPWYFWCEPFKIAWYTSGMFRYVCCLHSTWLVNSAAHIWGAKPFDKNIGPTENKIVSFFAYGEGWHNYHHVFPWDYKTSELGKYNMNITTAFIDFFAKIGWSYDLKSVPVELVRKRAERTGDGSHKRKDDATNIPQQPDETPIWDDTDMSKKDLRVAFHEFQNL